MSAVFMLLEKIFPPPKRDRVKVHRQSTVLMFILELPAFYTSSHW